MGTRSTTDEDEGVLREPRSRRLGRLLRLAVLLASAFLLAAGCGKGDVGSSFAPQALATGIVETPTIPTVEPVRSGPDTSLQQLAAHSMALSDGTTFDITIDVGAVFPFDGAHLDWEGIVRDCALDTSRDAYLPFQYTITNTTPGFTGNPYSYFSVNSNIGDVLRMGDDFRGCADSYNPYVAESNQESTVYADFPPGATQVVRGGIILVGFFTPDAPSGRFDVFQGQIEWDSWQRDRLFGGPAGLQGVLPITAE